MSSHVTPAELSLLSVLASKAHHAFICELRAAPKAAEACADWRAAELAFAAAVQASEAPAGVVRIADRRKRS